MKQLFLTSAIVFLFIASNAQNVGIGTTLPSAQLHVVSPNTTGTSIQLRLAPTGGGGSATSVPSLVDFYSTFDNFSGDQAPRRTATVKGAFSGGTWGNEALIFEVGTGGSNDAAVEPSERMRITGTGKVDIKNLAGIGFRPVYADSSGNLYTISGNSSNKATYSYTTSSNQSWTVPSGVNIIFVKLWGAGGGSGYSMGDGPGGGGGFVSGYLSVTPGTNLTIIVGQGGSAGQNNTSSTAAYGGGGAGSSYSGGGGGRSAIQITSGTDAVTAGAGGGGGKSKYYFCGGAGGGLVGGTGGDGLYTNFGVGGGQTATTSGVTGGGTCTNTNGGLYQGGTGCSGSYGGGGGAGYYGGGGGGNGSGNDGPGGGGSSYISGLVQYMPIRNEQGTTAASQNNYRPLNQPPGGIDGSDYSTTIGYGGGTVTTGTTGAAGGNGRVVIYW